VIALFPTRLRWQAAGFSEDHGVAIWTHETSNGGGVPAGRRRLAFFVHDLRGGGSERGVVRLANAAAARGIPTSIVAAQMAGPYLADLAPGVERIDLEASRTATAVLRLRRHLAEARYSHVIAHMTHINVAAVLARALSRRQTRLFVVEHNQFDRNRVRKRGMVRLAYRAVPLAYRFADGIFAVSEGVRETLASETGLRLDEIVVLPNPVVTDAHARLAEEAVTDDWFSGPAPVVLAVGRLARQKNFPLLIRAFARLRAMRPARLVILGEGEERPALATLAEELGVGADVFLPGFAANPIKYMRRAGVLALSSDWEGLPTVVIEAMACGTPVVATDCRSGPRELLGGGRWGRLVPPGDEEAFAAALADALESQGDGAAARQRAAEFSVDHSLDRYLAACGWNTDLGAAECIPR
jgi:glycosyltransferase involved in cell wall biosynthesis